MDLIVLKLIETPRTSIKLYMDEDKELVIPQNNLTVAIGYNRFLSLKSSRLGQFCDKANAVKKIGNRNMLKLDKVVKVVLPAFLKGYFREFNGQPSRQNFCRIDPKEIYHNAEIVLKILKERLHMGYAPNSLGARKGALGEAIVQKILEARGWIVEKPADTFKSGASIVDFYYPSSDGTVGNFAEVKTQIAYPYGIEKAPCYSLPIKQVEAYKEYAGTHGALAMFIVDPKSGKIYIQGLVELEQSIHIDGREYPLDKHVEIMGGDFHYWHRDQFDTIYPIPEDDLVELRKLFNIGASEEKQDTATAETMNADILTAPNGTNIDILTLEGYSRFFVKVARVSSAIGYTDPSISETAPLIEAARYLGVQHFRFETQRLSGNDSYGKKGYYFDVDDVPRVLAQYYEFNKRAKDGTKKHQRAQEALKLRDWFQNTVLPRFGRKHIENKSPTETPSLKDNLIQTANLFNVNAAELAKTILDLRQNDFERQQAELRNLLA